MPYGRLPCTLFMDFSVAYNMIVSPSANDRVEATASVDKYPRRL